MTSYWRSIATLGLSHRFVDKRLFRSKIAKFCHPLYFAPLPKGFPLEFGNGARGQKTGMMGLPDRERRLTISLALWIQCTNVTDRRKAWRTDTGRQQRQRLRIASRGKKWSQVDPVSASLPFIPPLDISLPADVERFIIRALLHT